MSSTPPALSVGPEALPPKAPGYSRRSTRLLYLALAVAAPLGLVVLYRFEPTETSFYPRCVLHQLTGLHCAGCGTTRALHALLHGDLRQALAYNSLTVLALPLLIYSFGRSGLEALGKVTPSRRPTSLWLVYLLFGVFMVFWVVRNLPFPPFNALAPHRLEGREPAAQP